MITRYIITFLVFFVFVHQTVAQQFGNSAGSERSLRIMFYNIENLFDTEDDSLTNDDEFLPVGLRSWTNYRYREKLHHISSVIVALGEWNPPDIIGLCEVENRKVLEDLCFKTGLSNLNYKIIHKESPDPRGIDVAMLYKPGNFKPVTYKAIQIDFPYNPSLKTRDILYVKGTVKNYDTLHLFVNHWPSRSGGQMETEPNRIFVSSVLKKQVDSLFRINLSAKIIIMGDFNDYPYDKSISDILNVKSASDSIQPTGLYNLFAISLKNRQVGSHKFEGEWGILDQIIVSGSLLKTEHGMYTLPEKATIFSADFLLENDEAYSGKKLFRTYNGYIYHGGYSDHLPVYVDLIN